MDTNNTPINDSSDNTDQSIRSGLLGMAFGLFIFCVILVMLNYFNVIQLTRLSGVFTFLPQQSSMKNKPVFVIDPPIEKNCNIPPQLLKHMSVGNNILVAEFYGKIKQYTYNSTTQNAVVEIMTINAPIYETYSFTLNNQIVKIHTVKNNQNTQLNNLKIGENIKINTTCDIIKNEGFNVTDISVM